MSRMRAVAAAASTSLALMALTPVPSDAKEPIVRGGVTPSAHADCGPVPIRPQEITLGGGPGVSAQIKANCVLIADVIWLDGLLYADGGLEASRSIICTSKRNCSFYLRVSDPAGSQTWQSVTRCKYEDHGIVRPCTPPSVNSPTLTT